MAIVSVSVPDKLKESMDQFPVVNWSAIAREAFQRKLSIEKFIRIAEKSKLSEKDAKKLADKINLAVSTRALKEAHALSRRR